MLLKADAAKFKLGILWWFLEPLIWVCVFYVVFNMILDSGRKGGDFVLFLAVGKFAFIWFSKTVIQASGAIIAGQGLIGKIDVPKSLFPMSAIHESLYRQSTIYLLLFVILLLGGVSPGLGWLWLLPIALTTYLMIIGCGFIAACLVCVVRDFQKFIPLGMTFLLFTSGIFWDVRTLGDTQKMEMLLWVNPLAFIIDAHRQALIHLTAPDLLHLAVIALGSVVAIVLSLWYMRRYSKLIALQVLT
ncbi:ABC transporter [Mangrovimicrobium sediminis]|uniref:Transport permease protein n=2 Tax=Mangrovimicrobium sediminis TaxID=2562682 RepID=A0A4Z0M065_9GAMM|nr:ABC transporter [Haliea sp. SAOS-164]